MNEIVICKSMFEYVRVSFIWNVRQIIFKSWDHNYVSNLPLVYFISYIIFLQQVLIKNYICLTSVTRAKPKEKMEFPA